MATYVVGDVHGRLDTLEELLACTSFDRRFDQIWFVGDLVNRGPRSMDTVEFVRRLGTSAVTVLGDHDPYLLKVAEGVLEEEPGERLRECLDHPAADRATEWLRHQPLIRIDRTSRVIVVHAGLPHIWRAQNIRARAAGVEALLSGTARECRSGPRSSGLTRSRRIGVLRQRACASAPHRT